MRVGVDIFIYNYYLIYSHLQSGVETYSRVHILGTTNAKSNALTYLQQ